MAVKSSIKKISLLEYAHTHNPIKNRRGHPMTFSYLYRIIRENEAGVNNKGGKPRSLWFKYEFDGDKDRIWVII